MRAQVAEDEAVVRLHLAWLAVHEAQRAQAVPVGADQRRAAVEAHAVLDHHLVVLEPAAAGRCGDQADKLNRVCCGKSKQQNYVLVHMHSCNAETSHCAAHCQTMLPAQ